MKLGDTLGLALRNLRQAKLRTGLTTLGVSIGIASLAGMVSLGVGLQDQIVGRLTQSGMFDAITVLPVQTGALNLGGRGGPGRGGLFAGRNTRRGPAVPTKPLDDDAIKAIAAVPDVKSVYPNIRVPVELQFEQFSGFSTIVGVPMDSRDEGAFQTMTAGAFFANDTDRDCLLSLDMAKRLSDRDPKDLIGATLTIAYGVAAPAGQPPQAANGATAPAMPAMPPGMNLPAVPRRVDLTYRIAGIVEREPGIGLGGGGAGGVMIPLAQARTIGHDAVRSAEGLGSSGASASQYQTLTVKVAHAAATEDVEDRVKALGYSAFSLSDALKAAKTGFIVLDIILGLIGSIALTVSSLGIINTMVMSILERTREIGVMKAIGGSDGDIRRIFLVEASAIGLLGGVTGVALGWLVGRVINFAANIYIVRQGGTAGTLFAVPVWLVAGAIGFSWLVSLVAGSYPASRAAKLDPIHALRHD